LHNRRDYAEQTRKTLWDDVKKDTKFGLYGKDAQVWTLEQMEEKMYVVQSGNPDLPGKCLFSWRMCVFVYY